MKITNYITRKLDNLGAAATAASGALTLGQFPQFLAQYVQRVGGHIDEATSIAGKYTLPEVAQRAQALTDGLEAITSSGTIGKLASFVQHVDTEIAMRALENYTPGITFDSEGALYCGLGALAGYIAYEGAKPVVSLAAKGARKALFGKSKK